MFRHSLTSGRSRRRTVGLAAACAAVVLLGIGGGSATATPAATSPPSATSTATGTVVLTTGEHLSVRQSAGKTVIARSTSSVPYLTRQIGADAYYFPAPALPYLGSVLDQSLFDVSYLAAHPAVRLPVSLTFSAGRTTVPGVTITATSGSHATGYLTADSAVKFGQALFRQWVSDQSTARSPSTLFGLSRMSTATTPVSGVHPNFPQETEIVRLVGPNGKPLVGDVSVVNVDDARKYAGFTTTFGGESRISVPKGHYAALGADFTFDKKTGHITVLLAASEFTVSQNLQTATVDLRTATASPSVRTPKPASVDSESFDIIRADRRGSTFDVGFGVNGGDTLKVSPIPRVTVGRLYAITSWSESAAPAGKQAYTYDLSFPYLGSIPAHLGETVTSRQLATVHSAFYSDGTTRQSAYGRGAIYPFQFGGFASLAPLSTPQSLTGYVYGGRGAVWFAGLIDNADQFSGFVSDDLRVYKPGLTYGEDWLRGPLGPGVPEQVGSGAFVCPACRTSTELAFLLAPVTDTTPGHFGDLDPPLDPKGHVARLRVFQDGKSIFDKFDYIGADLKVPAGEHTYRVIDQVDRTSGGFATSTSATVDLTFRSSATDGAGLPAGWFCGTPGSGRCSILPLMTTRVPLPTDLNGVLPFGTTHFDFTVGHIQGARAIAVTSAAFEISTDGVHFTPVPVTDLGGGNYRAALTEPSSARGRAVSVRVHGTDAAGGSITKTVLNAYTVAGS